MGLGGQEDLSPALAQGRSVIISAAGIGGRRITVSDAQVECAVDDLDRLRRFTMRAQYSLAAQAQDGNLLARSTQRSAGESIAARCMMNAV